MLKKHSLAVAIEGGSASGKTTLSKILKEFYDCTIFHMDDFFLRPEQRTPERYAEAGGNIDRERFFNEWIPLEKTYFSQMRVKQRSNISILLDE